MDLHKVAGTSAVQSIPAMGRQPPRPDQPFPMPASRVRVSSGRFRAALCASAPGRSGRLLQRSRKLRIYHTGPVVILAGMTKSVFVVQRTAEGFKYTRGSAGRPSTTSITRKLGNRSPAQAALEEGTAWLQEAAHRGSTEVEVAIEWE